jgi:3-phosphoshikimate 1-carboxyvinyltransferase
MPVNARCDLHVPGDKSISHRALILSALARGTSQLRGLLYAADTQSTASVLRALGVALPPLPKDGSPIMVVSNGPRPLQPPAGPLDCGNSGTTARLMLGVLAGHPFPAVLTGDASLRSRPMRRVTDPLSRMGAHFVELGEPDRLPIQVEGGPLRPIQHRSPHASAQVKSALLLAGLTGGAEVEVIEPVLSRDHTERLLRAMGADLHVETGPEGARITFDPPSFLEPLDLAVPGDFSSAAFFVALALLSRAGPLRIRGVGVNPTRTGLLSVLARMGGRVVLEDSCEICGEPAADLVAWPAELRGTEVGAAEIPAMIDEVPVLAILAARAHGETRITGAGELRVKETDRLAALAANLRAIGVDAEELADGLVIRGTDAPLAGRIRAFGDHRIAMAFGVLAALPGNRIEIDDPGVVAISNPAFWEDIRRAAAALEGS